MNDATDIDTSLAVFGSNASLARRLRMSRSAVSRWKQRGLVPEGRIYQLIRLADMTGVDFDPEPLLRLLREPIAIDGDDSQRAA